MLERSKKFVSDHKSQIVTAAVSAGVAGTVVFIYFNKKTFLHVPDDVVALLAADPENNWVSYKLKGVVLAMTAINENAV